MYTTKLPMVLGARQAQAIVTYWSSLFFITGLIALVSSCSPNPTSDGPAAPDSTEVHDVTFSAEQYKRAGITVGSATERQVPVMVQATGIVDVPPTAMVSIHVPIAGMVKNHRILPGAHVHKGELLCELEHQDIIQMQQDYLENASQLTYLKADAQRQQNLLSEEAGAAKKSELAAATYQMALAKHQGLEAKLHMLGINAKSLHAGNIRTTMRVLSPIDGYVKSVKVTQGAFVNPQDIMFEIVDKRHMHLELKVFERDAASIVEKQPLTFRAAATGNTLMKASIFLTGKTFDAVERTVNIHAHLQDEKDGDKLLPGMFVQAEILTSTKGANILPMSAIATDGDVNFVFVRTTTNEGESNFRQVPIKVLSRYENDAVVSLPTELSKSHMIVLTGAVKLQAQLSLGQGEEE